MTQVIDGVKYGYTNQGNPYKKSQTGKKVGTAVAVALPTAAMFIPYKTTMKLYGKILPKNNFAQETMKTFTQNFKNPMVHAKQFVKGSGRFKQLLDNKYLPKFLKSKGGRLAYLATVTTIGLAIWAGIGRLIGAGVDKIIDHGRKAQADKAARA